MKLQIEIDENEIKEQVTQIIVRNFAQEARTTERRMLKQEISQAVRDIIYKNKQEIIDRSVKQASAEFVRKGFNKFLEAQNDD